MSRNKVIERISSMFKEESLGLMEPKGINLSKFKTLEDIFNSIITNDVSEEASELCKSHLEEYPGSVIAFYIVGLLGYQFDNIDDKKYLRKLIEIFVESSKWAVVELLSDKMLEYGESEFALRAKGNSLERLGRKRDAIAVWESFLKIERFDAEIAKKLAFATLNEDQEKSIHYMKLSIEGFAKNRDFDEIDPLWRKLVSVSHSDIQFFERIERMLMDAKQFELAADLIKELLRKYKDEENPEQSIEFLKKILIYKPEDSHSRRELIKLYGVRYGDHSQFEQFMKLSNLNNFKVQPRFAIEDFEKNIVFDVGNYAYHNSWGLGQISEIDSDGIVINFEEKPEHRMSIKMALQSLKPIPKDHIYVMKREDLSGVQEMFKNNFMEFFTHLIKSYKGEILLADIKSELVPEFVEEKNWTKWWGKARTMIKKDPLFGVSDKKKNLIFMREKPITFSDELLGKFISTESFSEKLDIAIEFINNISPDEGKEHAGYIEAYFSGEMKGKSQTRQILSYFILSDLTAYFDPGKLKIDQHKAKVISFIKESEELPLFSVKITSYDYKKDFVNLIVDNREDWPEILFELLFERPLRIHKYIFNILIRSSEYKTINSFIDRSMVTAKEFPEIYIWIAKNILSGTWDFDWLDYSREQFVLTFFRLLNELKKIEMDGNRLKNLMLDILFNEEAFAAKRIVDTFDMDLVGKVIDIFENIPFIEEWQLDKLNELANERFENFQSSHEAPSEDWAGDVKKLIVSREGYDRKNAELNRMVNVDMVNLTRELGAVSEASGDIRENVEYNALMEKQGILKLAISRLKDDMQKADVLKPEDIKIDSVNVGTRVELRDLSSDKTSSFTILGPWDADFEKGILSYMSPIAKSMLGKKQGEEVSFRIDDEDYNFTVEKIEKYS